jgi:putative DNA primase/helicase
MGPGQGGRGLSDESLAREALEIAGLARLTPIEYDRVREKKAMELGIRSPTLDAEVRRARTATAARGNLQPPEFSDDALAIRFSNRHQHELRHIASWNKWLQWTGQVWQTEGTLQVFDYARQICREASAECRDENTAASVTKAATVSAVERLARSDRRHAASVEQWDADPWALNTPGGVVDLQSGKMHAHSPDYHLTKITAVAPGGKCEKWHDFLVKITNDNMELQDYLQRVAGYCLTGSTREHALFFAYGTGGNGKGVFLNTLTGILGDYASVASIDTFTASNTDRHPTDLAMLRGARLVTAQETEEGRRWAEARIKTMTGGDPITARFMRQDFFTFFPQFKLIIAGNHKPGLRNVDEAIRRRFNLIPFDVKIPAGERDPELPEKLKAEWPGILQWAIEGCLAWQRAGLKRPDIVSAATEDYFEAEDAVGQWLKECCVVSPRSTVGSTVLFKSWSAWAAQAGERPGSQKAFTQTLAARGFQSDRATQGPDKGKVFFTGLQAAIPTSPPPYSEYGQRRE